MNKINRALKKRSVVWLGVLVFLCITAVTVYAVLQAMCIRKRIFCLRRRDRPVSRLPVT